MSYQPSPLHTYFNLYQLADTLMNTQIDSPDLTVYDFAEWRALEPYRTYLNSPVGRETLTTWQEIFQPPWQSLKDTHAIISQDRYVSSYRLERYLMGGWQLSDVQYSYDSADIRSLITSIERMLTGLDKHVTKRLSKVS
jgi:hypothetical protein